jgi:hypothetical protein
MVRDILALFADGLLGCQGKSVPIPIQWLTMQRISSATK